MKAKRCDFGRNLTMSEIFYEAKLLRELMSWNIFLDYIYIYIFIDYSK